MKPFVRLAVLLLLVAGCVNTLAQRQAALNALIGQPEAVVIQNLGVPTRTFSTGDRTFLAWTESSTDIIPGSGGGWGWGGMWGGFPPQVVTFTCETTVEFQNGRMLSFTLRGNNC